MRRHLPGRLISTALLLACKAAVAVEPIDLHTDREAFTPSTFAVDPGRVLVEGSHVYIDNREGLPTNNYPELILRIGGWERLEWRFGFNYSVGSQGNVVTSVEAGELPIDGGALYESNVLYGIKLETTEQDGWIPQSCFIMEATTPTFGQEFGTELVATAVFGWEFPEKWRIDAALRYAYAESDVVWFSRWGPSVVARLPLTERWEVHAEYFGTFTQGLLDDVNRPFFSPGTHLVIGDNAEIGWRFGWGLTRDAASFFTDAGLAFRY
ncbi:MAG: hypothetical protein ISS73_09885 [Pirellulales bacterium]|nr:hypothetical protein [Pirellulales bacterium]